jgi:glycine/D-amino acid oxidase-like deaminating enzyme
VTDWPLIGRGAATALFRFRCRFPLAVQNGPEARLSNKNEKKDGGLEVADSFPLPSPCPLLRSPVELGLDSSQTERLVTLLRMEDDSDSRVGVVIVGAGVIGASCAYHLATLGVRSTVLEREAPACAASGRAGGFLARDWCDGSPSGALAKVSFAMHAKLADTLGADTEYRTLDTFSASLRQRRLGAGDGGSGVASSERKFRSRKSCSVWIDGAEGGETETLSVSQIGTTSTTAQVHPAKLTRAYLAAAEQLVGTKVMIATAVGVTRDLETNMVTGVAIRMGGDGGVCSDAENAVVPCSSVVFALGPWQTVAREWIPTLPRASGSKATSVVLTAERPAQAVFAEYHIGVERPKEIEVYPRPDGTVYVCGGSGADEARAVLPARPRDVKPGVDAVAALMRLSRAVGLVGVGDDGSRAVPQACYLPGSDDGFPVVGRVSGEGGRVYAAGGHSCWGILLSPATGLAVAEMIVFGDARCADVSGVDPRRLD